MRRVTSSGFTLIELLLSVSIIVILTGVSLPVFAAYFGRTDLEATTQGIAQGLRRAQNFSRGVNQDTSWGVYVQGGSATLFSGASYAARDTSYDESIPIDSATPSGLSEIVFSKVYGLPSSNGTITLTSTSNTNETRTITINAQGLVTY